MLEIIFYLLIGAGVGLLSGLFGIGGGIITIPALILILQQQPAFQTANIMHIATCTSLILIIITAFSSAKAYHARHALVWPLFWKILPGQCLGLACGSIFSYRASNQLLINLFAIFLIIIAIYIWLDAKRFDTKNTTPYIHPISKKQGAVLLGGGFLVGALSALFGIGGGILLVPLFLALNYTIQEASGTSVLCGLASAVLGSFFLAFLPHPSVQIPYMIGNIYWFGVLLIGIPSFIFAPLGTYLAFYWKPALLKKLFVGLLLITALNLLQIR